MALALPRVAHLRLQIGMAAAVAVALVDIPVQVVWVATYPDVLGAGAEVQQVAVRADCGALATLFAAAQGVASASLGKVLTAQGVHTGLVGQALAVQAVRAVVPELVLLQAVCMAAAVAEAAVALAGLEELVPSVSSGPARHVHSRLLIQGTSNA